MADALYSIYAVAILIVAVGGLVGVVFGTPDTEGGSKYRFETLAAVAALFIVAMVGSFVL
ncbi:hypothetical protein [Natrinema salifodinae]|uniref:Uncharacterized protein n=1 Tax=Natrinema salifodinae TaxID=1202768 RepID=A0A1I0MBB1_9EURY|nr:hypothetical protein [Natrinema salifodinae]SEV85040.1 hypothetical protein SAMN05216285_0677 [Natrinema salifodinae]